MFVNYENVPTSYIPNNTTICPPCTAIRKKPLEEYDAFGKLIGYSWYYGDQIVLEFNITGNVVYDSGVYEDVSTEGGFLHKKKLRLQFLDFRYEVIYDVILPAAATTKFYINNVTAERFVRGAYRCKLTLIDDTDEQDIQTYTLIDVDQYIFCVK